MTERRKKLNSRVKTLENSLLEYMTSKNITEVEGYTLPKLQKRLQPGKRKPKKEQYQDALNLFRQLGFSDPAEVYRQFKLTQQQQSSSLSTPSQPVG